MATGKLQENLSKYFYSGIGLAAHTADAVQKSMDEFVKNGKMNEANGKKIVGDAMKKVEKQRSMLESRYNEALHKLIHVSAVEVSKLQKRIERLEKKGAENHYGETRVVVKTLAKNIKNNRTHGKRMATTAKRSMA